MGAEEDGGFGGDFLREFGLNGLKVCERRLIFGSWVKCWRFRFLVAGLVFVRFAFS